MTSTRTPLPLGAIALDASPPEIAPAPPHLGRSRESLSGHPAWSRLLARLVPHYEYDDTRFFAADDAPADVAALRRAAFMRLAAIYRERFASTRRLTTVTADALSDLQLTSAYRVPFQFRGLVRIHLGSGAFIRSSSGVTLTDLDGNRFYDLTGSYGVNVFGHDFYKGSIARGSNRVEELGAVLGSYHPVVAHNVRRLREISGHDEVSFHMSGTEAVMMAVRLARYHTGRRRIVRFAGAYHGWWGDVQPGVGNPVPPRDTLTLREMSAASLRALRRHGDIACVLVNPVQALHPNRSPPADSALIDSSRTAHFDRDGYAAWLANLRDLCTRCGIVLILDDIFTGFRLAPGGAQQFFGIRADLVTYGKSLGGGLPIGVLCGRGDLMRRFRDDRPADICLARGTFNSHPYVMGAMAELLDSLERPEIRKLYEGLDEKWTARRERFNLRLRNEGLPVRAANLSSVWTILYTTPSHYNWMLQFYLRAEQLALSWIGTGRLIFSLDYTDAEFDAVTERFVAAARAMRDDGWWWSDGTLTNRAIRRRILAEMIAARLGRAQTTTRRDATRPDR
jgi:glutamate-1-semialdehyde 2,1-aminomutase